MTYAIPSMSLLFRPKLCHCMEMKNIVWCRLLLCTWGFLDQFEFAARYVFTPQCICLPSQLSVYERTTFPLPNMASWCKGLFACWSISPSGLVLQHECSLKNMYLFSLWLHWIIFSSSHNGSMGCAKQHVPGLRERRCFLRTENVLKNASSCWQESRLYIMNWGFSFHGSLQSTVLTSTSLEDVRRL